MNESDNSWQGSALEVLSSLTLFDKDDDSHLNSAGTGKPQDSWRSPSPPSHLAGTSSSFPERPLNSGTKGALDNKDLASRIGSLTERLKLKSSAAVDQGRRESSSNTNFTRFSCSGGFNTALKTQVPNGSLVSDKRHTTERKTAINYRFEDDSVFEDAPFAETSLMKNDSKSNGSRNAVAGVNGSGWLGLNDKPWTASNNSKSVRNTESVLSNRKTQELNDLLTDFVASADANYIAITKSKKPPSWYDEKDNSILKSSEGHDKSKEVTSLSDKPYTTDNPFTQWGKSSPWTAEGCGNRAVLVTSSVQEEEKRRNGCVSSADQNDVTPGAVPDNATTPNPAALSLDSVPAAGNVLSTGAVRKGYSQSAVAEPSTLAAQGMRRRSEADVRSIADIKKERLLRRMSTLSHENRLEQERLRSARQDLQQHINTERRQDAFHLELLRNEHGLHGGVQEALGRLEGEQGRAGRGVERPEGARPRVVYHRATWQPAIRGDPFQHSLTRPSLPKPLYSSEKNIPF